MVRKVPLGAHLSCGLEASAFVRFGREGRCALRRRSRLLEHDDVERMRSGVVVCLAHRSIRSTTMGVVRRAPASRYLHTATQALIARADVTRTLHDYLSHLRTSRIATSVARASDSSRGRSSSPSSSSSAAIWRMYFTSVCSS